MNILDWANQSLCPNLINDLWTDKDLKRKIWGILARKSKIKLKLVRQVKGAYFKVSVKGCPLVQN